ncbi:hypothetical protein NRB20_68700 [Nocardia sp. RB20]|uniref:Uncharacterized protein n=1 Tax=Nocardia macrotermitis TaxID=2585198 RepID=A0A7K0DDP4_9NOCA|nr:hypothetical protein [Nocardia macrotermitis]
MIRPVTISRLGDTKMDLLSGLATYISTMISALASGSGD